MLNEPAPERCSFSTRRTARLLLIVLAGSMLPGLPMAIIKFAKHTEQQREEQEQMQRQMSEMEKAAQEGKAGEATRRLFGIEE